MRRKPYERMKEVHGFSEYRHVLIQIFYYAAGKPAYGKKMPKGYYLCVKPVSNKHGFLTYDMDFYSMTFLCRASDGRFSKAEYQEAIKLGEALVPEKIEHLMLNEKSNNRYLAAA
ncbi:hypothetical protein LJC32_01990 [Oscillospiraceae bacterium OttesenSCG-928-F05]|nr:hypothetical protein [Oscillospiraceae bacterium OttesenSCG-928-F05]